jgi:hypothetical protein
VFLYPLWAQSQTVFIKIAEPSSDPTGVLDRVTGVLVGSIGLTGVITLLAIAVGALTGGLLFWTRRRNPLEH